MEFPFKKIISATLIGGQFTLMFYNIQAYATTAVEQAHSDGYNWTRQAQSDFNGTSANGSTITFGNSRLNQSLNATGGPLYKNSLTPQTSGAVSEQTYYASGSQPTVDSMSNVKNLSETEIDNTAIAYQDRLDNELKNNNASIESQVYSIMSGSAGKSKVLDTNDPMFKQSNDVLSRTNPTLVFSCGIDSQIKSVMSSKHTEIKKECTNVPTSSCTLIHEIYPATVIQKKTVLNNSNEQTEAAKVNNLMVEGCYDYRENCSAVGVGKYYKEGEKLNTNSCQSGNIVTELAISNKEAIKKATMKKLRINGPAKATILRSEKVLWDFTSEGKYPLSCVPNDTKSATTFDMETNPYYKADITTAIKETSGDSVSIEISYTGAIPYFTIEIDYDPAKLVTDDMWTDDVCAQYATSIHEGNLQGEIECKANFPMLTGEGEENSDVASYVYIDGVSLNKKYLKSFAGLPSTCMQATVTVATSNFTDDDGNPRNDTNKLTECKDLFKQEGKTCSFLDEQCLKWGQEKKVDEHGNFVDTGNRKCVLTKSVYDCGYDTSVELTDTQTNKNCPKVSCTANDCINIKIDDATEDFAKAMGLMNMSQQGTSDVTCSNPKDTGSCVFFKGEEDFCNQSYYNGGLGAMGNDCCNLQGMTGVDVATNVRQIASMWTTHGVWDGIKTGDINVMSVSYTPFGYDTRPPINEGVPNGSAGGSAVRDDNFSVGVAGTLGWQMLQNFTGVGRSFKMFTSRIINGVADKLNNIVPYAGDVFATVANMVVDYLMSALVQMCWDFIYGAITEAIGGTAVGAVLGSVGGMMSSFATKCIPIIGWIYAIYKLATIIVNIWTKCTDKDYELQQHKDLHNCDYVQKWCSLRDFTRFNTKCFQYTESYCCFNSPLSRILNKQIRYARRGCNPWHYPYDNASCAFYSGSRKHPDCRGITMAEFQSVDWKHIDLTEWLMLLQISGAIDTSLDSMRQDYLPFGGYDSAGNKHDLNNQNQNAGNYIGSNFTNVNEDKLLELANKGYKDPENTDAGYDATQEEALKNQYPDYETGEFNYDGTDFEDTESGSDVSTDTGE